MIIYLDMDGVLCDFHKALLDYHNKTDPYYNPDNLGKYGLSKLLNMKYMDLMGDLTSDFWANLKPTPWCFDLISLCESLSTQVYISTAPASNKHCLSGKYEWVEKYYPKLLNKMMIGKDKFLLAANHTILIDDKYDNIEKFNQYGGHGVLVPQPWNRLYEENTWEYLQKIIPTVYDYWAEL